jgi:hypothetical protein
MPYINLKTKSPEYEDAGTQHADRHARTCDALGCNKAAGHKAPKDRGLSEYYHFCYEHVCAYNRNWDFFEGMNAREIEDYIVRSALGDRQTWRFANYKDMEDIVFKRAWQFYHFTDKEPEDGHWQGRQDSANSETSDKRHNLNSNQSIPEYEALDVMGLTPPVDLAAIKKKYKQLVKQYHPDHNRDNNKAEETMKRINMAYATLKVAYERFENLNGK